MNEQEAKYNPEEELKSINAIERLQNFLQDRKKITSLYEKLVNDRYVQESGIIYPTVDQVIRYFELTLKGIEYSRETYGDKAVPKNFSVNTGTITIGDKKDPDFIAYAPEKDDFRVSFLHIAEVAETFGRKKHDQRTS